MKRILSIIILLLSFEIGFSQTVFPIVADTVKVKTPPVHVNNDVILKIQGNLIAKRGYIDTIYFKDGSVQFTALTTTLISNWNTAYSWGDWHSTALPKWDSSLAKAFIAANYVPLSRTINSYALTSNISLNKTDIGLSAVPNIDATNPANISQTSTYRFSTDAEKATWNGKQNALGYTPENVANKAVDFNTLNNTLYPSVQAVKTYADALVVGLVDDRGNWSAALNTYPTTGGSGASGIVVKGDLYFINAAGVLGTDSIFNGDQIRALVDLPGQTSSNWAVLRGKVPFTPENIIHKSDATTLGYSSLLYPTQNAVKVYTDAAVVNGNTAYSWGNHATYGYSTASNTQTFTNKTWNGVAIANAYLVNSSVTIGSTNIALGTTSTSLAGLTTVFGSGAFTDSNFILSGGTGNTGLYYGHTNRVVLANYTVGGAMDFVTNGGAGLGADDRPSQLRGRDRGRQSVASLDAGPGFRAGRAWTASANSRCTAAPLRLALRRAS